MSINGRRICMNTAAPFSELVSEFILKKSVNLTKYKLLFQEKALNELNTHKAKRYVLDHCQSHTRRPEYYLYDKMRVRFADHIKNAIYKGKWEILPSLILAYMESGNVSETRRTYLLKVTF